VISVVGDGTYVLGVPSACHLASAIHELPVVWIVCNNAGWAYLAIETAVVHPHGNTMPGRPFPLCGFRKPDDYPEGRVWPAYEKVVEAFGGGGATVRRPQDVPRALQHALDFVRTHNRQYLLNIDCANQPFPF
jgi:acetolactate synthase-1/2/3 large subunit